METKNIIKINDVMKYFSLMILITPVFIMHYNIKFLVYIYMPLELMSILYLRKHNNWKINNFKYLLFIIFFEIIVFIPTYINHRLSYSYICLLIAEIELVVYILNQVKNGFPKLIIDLSNVLRMIWIVDIISVIVKLILKTHTNSDYGFVGHKNYHAFLFLLVIGFGIMSNIINKKKAIDEAIVITFVINIVIEFIVSSASGVVTILTLFLMCFMMTKDKLKLINLKNIFITLLALNYILIFAVSNISIIKNILAFLGRDIGMSGRSRMWSLALEYIKEKPFLGYGFSTPVTIWSVVANEFVQNHCHNFYINIALSGGVIYLLLICIYIFIVAHRINEGGNNPILKVLSYTIGCYMLLGTSEILVNVMPVLFPLLTIGYFSKKLIVEDSGIRYYEN